ncbi:hypothetical protein CONLIGDRAFT_682368 [Coniochaeta ligniaria NRRL 30616]|uniref:Uncharacterized protein n=1 Tax=Coniochaeta ligniaria NRRL 30616 TaxID=1408157 RepID=A0A1J7JC17_9PEZI|nr:hypothetical protein CONLIGDRAFT_682368 [Coniochaeta ligniaria NRRL 30616]
MSEINDMVSRDINQLIEEEDNQHAKRPPAHHQALWVGRPRRLHHGRRPIRRPKSLAFSTWQPHPCHSTVHAIGGQVARQLSSLRAPSMMSQSDIERRATANIHRDLQHAARQALSVGGHNPSTAYNDVLTTTGEIGCAMIKTIALSLGWEKGKDCKDIVIWQKFTFQSCDGLNPQANRDGGRLRQGTQHRTPVDPRPLPGDFPSAAPLSTGTTTHTSRDRHHLLRSRSGPGHR